ncbi:hypothetical protein IJT93_11505 [bacterium]|nr:hypothetical protein [bacterium]
MICPECHKELYDGAVCCPDCGISTAEMAKPTGNSYSFEGDEENSALPQSLWFWRIFGFLLGCFGFIIWFVYRKSNPERAKAAAAGALISTVLGSAAEVFVAYLMFQHHCC